MTDVELYSALCKEIVDAGVALGGPVGAKLSNCLPGGDYRDLLKFIGKAGGDVPHIKGLLEERGRLAILTAEYPKGSV
jgi:hypothetical protein